MYHGWSCMAMDCDAWSCVTMHGHAWPYMATGLLSNKARHKYMAQPSLKNVGLTDLRLSLNAARLTPPTSARIGTRCRIEPSYINLDIKIAPRQPTIPTAPATKPPSRKRKLTAKAKAQQKANKKNQESSDNSGSDVEEKSKTGANNFSASSARNKFLMRECGGQ
ncbi:hypothetical protein C8R45DRAFT_937118 [Mycena sanguinolenta]|nr:hypothetical protein C8R45DRAFT_937118 [Mycena sanguinolenta]